MTREKFALCLVVCCFLSSSPFAGFGKASNLVEARKGVGDVDQKWGYAMVRPRAYMFWWLYFTTADVKHYTERPLVIWLQGGPGMPSSGYGNFVEIGPLTMKLEKRNTTWVKDFNLLFLDNPIGVGYSYIDGNATALVRNNRQIGRDLTVFLIIFLKDHPEFQRVPLYIFGESYGGKMAAEFALQMHKAIQENAIRANLRGIGLGDAYISPMDYINNYAPLAKALGFIDKHGYERIEGLARQVRALVERDDFVEASEFEIKITNAVIDATQGIDIYNILVETNVTSLPRFLRYQDECNAFMNTKIKEALSIPEDVEWSFINDDIYSSLQMDLMQPVTKTIEKILNDTDIKVIVYNGVLDFIVNTAGTVSWLDNLRWRRAQDWSNKSQHVLEVDAINEGYVKKVDKLAFYTVLRAGHSVPIDNPRAMGEILRRELLADVS